MKWIGWLFAPRTMERPADHDDLADLEDQRLESQEAWDEDDEDDWKEEA